MNTKVHRKIRLNRWPYGALVPLLLVPGNNSLYERMSLQYAMLPVCKPEDKRMIPCEWPILKFYSIVDLLLAITSIDLQSSNPLIIEVESEREFAVLKRVMPLFRARGLLPMSFDVIAKHIYDDLQLLELTHTDGFSLAAPSSTIDEYSLKLCTICLSGYSGKELLHLPSGVKFPLSLLPLSSSMEFVFTHHPMSGEYHIVE